MRFKLLAFYDLLKQYGAVFRHSWKNREEMQSIARLPHEVQFLPSALALQETPLSPAPQWSMRLIILFAVLALIWACWGRVEVVATAQGKVVSSDRTKTIQPFETSTVKHIWVSDGQVVKAGDVLVDLDATVAQADIDRIQADMGAAQLQVARGRALLGVLDRGGAPSLTRPMHVSNLAYFEAQRLLLGQVEEFQAKRSRIQAETARREAELRSTLELVRKLEQTVPIAQQRAKDLDNLVRSQFISKHNFLDQEKIRIEQEGDLANQKSRLNEIQAALDEVRGQQQALTAETRRTTMDSILEAQKSIAVLEQEQLKANSRGNLMRLTSPVDGTVQQLSVHTVGGVVTPAQAIMVIVPNDHPVEVEAFIENKDVGFVFPKQSASVKVETFQYTKYGTIDAEVLSVSRDAINDEKRGLIYSTRIKMAKPSVLVQGVPIHLTQGMAVTVEIKTGSRRVIEYFLSPLIEHTTESLRER